MVKILHVLDHSLPLQSGYSFRTIGILTAQRKRGWETVQVTTPKQYRFEAPVDRVDGWTFFRTPQPSAATQRLPVMRELFQMCSTRSRLQQVIDETQPDILHAHSPVLNALPALSVGRARSLPVIYEVRSLWEDAAVDAGTAREGDIRYRATRRLETYVLRRVDAITTICEGLRGDILGRGIPDAKVTVVPNAIDAELFTPERQTDIELQRSLGLENCIVLGFIGSFYAYEGLDLLLEALARLRQQGSDVKLLLVGGGPQKDSLGFSSGGPRTRSGGGFYWPRAARTSAALLWSRNAVCLPSTAHAIDRACDAVKADRGDGARCHCRGIGCWRPSRTADRRRKGLSFQSG